MQRVKFTNPRGEEVIIGLAPPYVFNKITGEGAMEADLIASTPAAIDGETLHGMQFKPRDVTVTLHVEGQDRKDLYYQRQRLNALLTQQLYAGGDLGRLEYTNDNLTVWVPAAVKKGPQASTRTAEFLTNIPITFRCPDPLWRAATPSVHRIAFMEGGLEFPLVIDNVTGFKFGITGYEAKIYNPGDWPAPIKLEIAGPALMPGIVKVSTGEYIRVKRQLYAGDVLTLDTTPGHRVAEIERANGVTESAFGYVDLTSTWSLSLTPGDNAMQYFGADDSRPATIILTSYGRYGGV